LKRRRSRVRTATAIAGCLIALALTACGRHEPTAAGAGNGASDEVALPKPAATGGSVTGMPAHPGPGQIGPQPEPSGDTETPADAGQDSESIGDEAAMANAALAAPDGTAPAEPGADEAAAVISDYYQSIDALDYAHAWSLWSDGGRASGQTVQQFANGFASTAHVTVDIGAAGAMEGAAGSRYVQVPVTIQATARDGSVQRYAGSYTLRRAVVDGATPEQRAWHIASATLHPVQP
jgi:hypothetical protein